MKKLAVFVAIALLLALPIVAIAATPGGPFSSAFRVQNLSTSVANCVYTFYNASGAAVYSSASSTINPGDSLYVFTPSVSGLPNGEYSGVVSCDQQVAAVVNWSDPNSGASFEGVDSADTATTLYAPGIYDNYYNYYSNIYVQNSSSSPINVTVQIFAPGSSSPVATQTFNNLAANASRLFEQEGLAQLNQNVAYSAKIVATGNVAAIVNIYGRAVADNQLYSYNAFKAGSTKAYAPVLMSNYFGYNTSLNIQNLGASSTPYTVTYGTGVVRTGTIAANSSVSLYTPNNGVPAGTLTSATIQSGGQPIVVLVNESNVYNRAASYTGFSTGNTKSRAPIVMKAYFNFNTSVTCQNLGASATTMTIDYANTPGTTSSPSIQPGKTHLFYQPSDSNMLNGITSATITSGQPIACIVNEDTNTPPLSTTVIDNLYAYEGIAK